MNTAFLRRLSAGWLAMLALALAPGCVTKEEVQSIVSAANLASISAELNPSAAAPTATGGGQGWQEASRKIDAFIAANPEQAVMNATLRVRQAVLLLNNKQYNLAEAAFNEAALGNLVSARDRSLKKLQSALLWWYRTAGDTAGIDQEKGRAYREAIATELKDLSGEGKKPDEKEKARKENESIHDFLAAVAAEIGIKMAKDTFPDQNPSGGLKKAIDDYVQTLAADEIAGWPALEASGWPNNLTLETAVTAANRRHFWAQGVIDDARRAMRASNIAPPAVENEYFRRKLAER